MHKIFPMVGSELVAACLITFVPRSWVSLHDHGVVNRINSC